MKFSFTVILKHFCVDKDSGSVCTCFPSLLLLCLIYWSTTSFPKGQPGCLCFFLLRLKLLVLELSPSYSDACCASVRTRIWSSAYMLGMPDMVVYIYNLNNGEVETGGSLRFSGSHLVYSGKFWATKRGCLSNKVHSNSQLKWNLKSQGLYRTCTQVYMFLCSCVHPYKPAHTHTHPNTN